MKNRAFHEMKKRFVTAAKTQRKPILGHFELTSRCNLDCKMCYVHTMDNATAMRTELSTEQWKRIFDEAYNCEMLYATLSGGECLLRQDFKELYLHLWNKKVMITVMTNGTMLNEDYVEFFKTYPPELIRISLYGSSEEGYLSLTGHKGFERATAAVEALMAAGIDVNVVTTPSRYMTDDYIRTVKMCKERAYDLLITDVTLIPNRDNPEKDDYFLTTDETFELVKERAEVLGRMRAPVEAPEPFGGMCEPPRTGLTCNAGNCLAVVTAEGRMYPCANGIIGEGPSLLEMSYAEAWEKTKAVADGIVLPVECVGCPYDKTCPKCPFHRLQDLTSGHCRTEVCELNKRLVAAGVKKLIPVE